MHRDSRATGGIADTLVYLSDLSMRAGTQLYDMYLRGASSHIHTHTPTRRHTNRHTLCCAESRKLTYHLARWSDVSVLGSAAAGLTCIWSVTSPPHCIVASRHESSTHSQRKNNRFTTQNTCHTVLAARRYVWLRWLLGNAVPEQLSIPALWCANELFNLTIQQSYVKDTDIICIRIQHKFIFPQVRDLGAFHTLIIKITLISSTQICIDAIKPYSRRPFTL